MKIRNKKRGRPRREWNKEVTKLLKDKGLS